MNSRFPVWYKAAAIDPKDEFLRKRWLAVEKFGGSANLAQALDLVRIFHGKPVADKGFVAAFESAIQAHDAAFIFEERGQENAVLAGAALTCLLEKKSLTSNIAALAVLTLHCRGIGSPGAVPEIVKIHRDYLTARTIRPKVARPVGMSWASPVDLKAPLAKATAATDIAAAVKEIFAALQPLAARIAELGSSINEFREDNQQFREESDVLWWMTGGHSRDLKCPFSELPSSAACIVAGKELADIVTSAVGPFGAPAFLDRVLRLSHPIRTDLFRFSEVVLAIDPSWSQGWIDGNHAHGIESLCPLAHALREYSDAKDGWQSRYARIGAVAPEAQLSGGDFACQAYEEALLVRRIGRVGVAS